MRSTICSSRSTGHGWTERSSAPASDSPRSTQSTRVRGHAPTQRSPTNHRPNRCLFGEFRFAGAMTSSSCPCARSPRWWPRPSCYTSPPCGESGTACRLHLLEARLDPGQFVRLARGVLVKGDLIARMAPMPGGTYLAYYGAEVQRQPHAVTGPAEHAAQTVVQKRNIPFGFDGLQRSVPEQRYSTPSIRYSTSAGTMMSGRSKCGT